MFCPHTLYCFIILFEEGKKISTGKQMLILVCIGFVWFSINLTSGQLSLCYYYVISISRRREKSSRIADPETL